MFAHITTFCQQVMLQIFWYIAIAITKQLLKSINCGQENTTSSDNKSKSLNFMPVSVVILYVCSNTLLCNSYRDIHCNYGYTLEVLLCTSRISRSGTLRFEVATTK